MRKHLFYINLFFQRQKYGEYANLHLYNLYRTFRPEFMIVTTKTSFYFHRLTAPVVAAVFIYTGHNIVTDYTTELIVAGMLFWMLYWWISGAVSIGITSLIPLIYLPFTGILSFSETSVRYANPIIFLFLGGFMLAIVLEKYHIHRYVADRIVRVMGYSLRARVRSLLLASALLSMWISNTATALIMLPIAMSFSDNASHILGEKHIFHHRIFIAIAAGANIGGISTLVGTPPNLFFAAFARQEIGITIDFFKWMMVGVPIASLLLFFADLFLTKGLSKSMTLPSSGNTLPLNRNQKIVIAIFSAVALIWMGKPLFEQIPGMGEINDAVVALTGIVVMCLIPQQNETTPLVEWSDLKQIPWDIMLLFGAGLSLATALQIGGVFALLQANITGMSYMNIFTIITLFTLIGIFLTEAMSNIAMVAVLLPYIYEITTQNRIDFSLIAIPLVIGASCAFMLPISTPPNAIVFGSGRLKVRDMVRFGLKMNLISLIVIIFFTYLLINYMGLFSQLK
jgi:solute carrier family 13 (sodium-dependent dicarboxylate transporter), member 2/3/5